MKNPFIIHDTLTNRISFYHIILFVASLPFDRFYSEIILISFVLHTLIHFDKSNLQDFPIKQVLLLQGTFLITVLASVYTVNPSGVSKEWEKQLAIL
ncbi:MAG TPA: hypothetical protein VLJ41_08580, partial [Segetibacter sp.]|nr:hypothetical protein [Segetibacter sp.]